MPAERYYVETPLTLGEILLEGKELHHLSVMRTRVGEEIELVDGCGTLAFARVKQLSKTRASLQVESLQHAEASPTLILAQALPRQSNLEWILEKGTELGATEFWLFPGMLSEKKELSENQQERAQQILISAMKQCGRLDLPTIVMKPALSNWTSCKEPLLYGSTDPQAPRLFSAKRTGPCIFCVGPEKGFHPNEIAQLKRLDAQGVSLHPNILRTETAAITALALLSQIP